MVRIVELFEAIDLPRPLKPGEQANLKGSSNVDPEKYQDMRNLHQNQHELFRADLDRGSNFKYQGLSKLPKTNQDRQEENEKITALKSNIKNTSEKYLEELAHAIPFIKQKCSKFLPIFHNVGFIYRGFSKNDANHPVFYGYPRQDRLPLDSDKEWQKIFDDFSEHYGAKALRGNSIFCTSLKLRSQSYGLSYIILPTNDARYTFSRKEEDLILSSEAPKQIIQFFENIDEEGYDYKSWDKYGMEFIKLFGLEMDEDMAWAIENNHEIWIKGHYIAVLSTLEPQLREMLFGQRMS